MMNIQNKEWQVFVSAAFAGLLYYLGIVSIPIIMLIFAMIIDYATGMSAAQYNSELSSKRGVKGIVKKVGYLALVAAAMIQERADRLGNLYDEVQTRVNQIMP